MGARRLHIAGETGPPKPRQQPLHPALAPAREMDGTDLAGGKDAVLGERGGYLDSSLGESALDALSLKEIGRPTRPWAARSS